MKVMALAQFGAPKAIASPEAEIEFMRRLAGLPSVVMTVFGTFLLDFILYLTNWRCWGVLELFKHERSAFFYPCQYLTYLTVFLLSAQAQAHVM